MTQSKPVAPTLVRRIRRWDLVGIAINAIIGAGIFGIPSKVYALIGTYSLLAFVACAIVVILIILCFAEVGSRFDATGGPYLYAREAFGPTVGFEVGWLMWLARVTAFGANGNLLVSYLSYLWPPAASTLWRPTIIIGTVLLLTILNLIGVHHAAVVSNWFTLGKLLPLLFFVVAGLFFINGNAYTFGPTPTVGAFSQSVLVLVYAFTGFEMASIPVGEVNDPRRDLPISLIIALAVVATLYIFIQIVCVGTLPGLGQSQRPLADAATRFLGAGGGAIISAGALISITGNLNILLLAGSRIPYAMAEQQQLPGVVAKIYPKRSTPYVAITLTAIIMLVLTLKSSFFTALTISAIARLATYAATCISLPVFRRRKDFHSAVFVLPGGTIWSVTALVLIIWLLANSTKQEALTSALVAVIGLVVCLSYRVFRARS